VLIGEDCVIGNSTEIKNSIVFDGAQLPHYNYVGDSVIGYRAHFGAGAIASNVRADKRPVVVHTPTAELHTDRRKVGAMVGDGAEIGCGAVLAPGAVIGRESTVYPLTFVRGCVPCGVIVKSDKSIIKRI
jgi:NDP-sugar pyrophosphorylase family protein